MTLVPLSQPEPLPEEPEEPAPSRRRRFLIIIGVVIALILGGGSATYLLLNSSLTANRSADSPYTPPVSEPSRTDSATDPTSASPSASGSASASASTSRSASPSHTPTAPPPGGGGGGGVPVPVTYRVTDLCASADLTPIQHVAGASGSTVSDNKPFPSGYTDYICSGTYGKIAFRVDAWIFSDPTAASASYADDKSAVGGEVVGGVGRDAFGSPNGDAYGLWGVDGNLKFKVRIQANEAGHPPPTLRQAAIDTARATLPKLRA